MFPFSRFLWLRTDGVVRKSVCKTLGSSRGYNTLVCRTLSFPSNSQYRTLQLYTNSVKTKAVGRDWNGVVLFRSFRTTAPRQAIPPVLLVLASKLGKYLAVFMGRRFRVWYTNLPAEAKTEYAATAKRHRTIIYTLLGGLGLGAWYYYYSHVSEAPITKRTRFVIFNDEQIDQISRHELDILVDAHREKILNRDHPAHKQVYRVATKLLEANKDLLREHGKDKQWTITVVEDKIANAFVLSCGSVFVFTGLLDLCAGEEGDSDSRLAIILGHELSHVLLNHSAEQASFLHLLDLFLIVPFLALWALIPTDATTAVSQWLIGKMTDVFLTLPFGRSLEAEADNVGLVLAARACFDIRECVIWKKMQLMNNSDIQIELFSTHPSEESRFESLQEQLPAALDIRSECKCPKLSPFDLQKRIEAIEKQVKEKSKMEDVLVPIKIDLSSTSGNKLPVLTKWNKSD